MKLFVLLPICWFILGCASDRPSAKVVGPASGSGMAAPALSLQESVNPEARAAIEQLHAGMSEFDASAIMMPVSQTWRRQPSYTEPDSADLYFGVSPTQELPLWVSLGKVVSIGSLVPARLPVQVFAPGENTSPK
jgi:hypothetical protein